MIDPALGFPPAGYVRGNGRTKPSPPLIQSQDLGKMIQPVEELIVKYPAAALASAFLLGVVLACWIKRK